MSEEKQLDPMTMPDITKHPLYQDGLKLALKRQAKIPMSPAETTMFIRLSIDGLTRIPENNGLGECMRTWKTPAGENEWKDYITDDYIECMICGVRKLILTEAHLRSHGGSREIYRRHFHIPANVPLTARKTSEKRSRDMKRTQIWKLKNGAANDPANETEILMPWEVNSLPDPDDF